MKILRAVLVSITHVKFILFQNRSLSISDKEITTIKISHKTEKERQEKTLFWYRIHAYRMQFNGYEVRYEESISMYVFILESF